MSLLVMCECSGTVTKAFRAVGVEAWSCDLQETYGDLPQYHLKMDCFKAFNLIHPDMVIAHPPCTFLSNCAEPLYLAHRNKLYHERWRARCDAIGFFFKIWCLPVRFLCVENPKGVMGRVFRPPDQTVNPYDFGDLYAKRTCLWLRGLPNLVVGDRRPEGVDSSWFYHKIFGFSLSDSRSKTFPGLAAQMALQWSVFAE